LSDDVIDESAVEMSELDDDRDVPPATFSSLVGSIDSNLGCVDMVRFLIGGGDAPVVEGRCLCLTAAVVPRRSGSDFERLRREPRVTPPRYASRGLRWGGARPPHGRRTVS